MRGKNSTIYPNYSRSESAGLQAGLTECNEFVASGEAPYSDASFNESSSGASGRSTSGGGFKRQVKGRRSQANASNKGNSFDLEG